MRILRIPCVLLFACLSLLGSLHARAQEANRRIVTAANAFLATLPEAQRKRVLYAFDDEEQRRRWSNLPISIVQRGGLSFRDMDPTQRAAAMTLLSTVLSARGYEKVQQIMGADELLKTTDTGPSRGGAMFGADLYFISFLGTPSETVPWMMQFGGHHLAINITVKAGDDILTPTLTGAQPAIYRQAGRTVRPLAGESDKALALLHSLDEKQRSQAVLSFRVADLALGPGQDGRTIEPEGLKVSTMTAAQKQLLMQLITEWAGIVNDTASAARLKVLQADLDQTWFAWSGPTTDKPGDNITAYYRVQGPHLVIEYAPQGNEPTTHVHTMYRDPTNDYGRTAAR